MSMRRRSLISQDIQWDYEWDAGSGKPMDDIITNTISNGTVSYIKNEYLELNATYGTDYAGFKIENYEQMDSFMYEMEFMVVLTFNNGMRFVCGNEGTNKGLQFTINNNFLNILTRDDGLSSITKTAPVQYNTWNKIKVQVDAGSGSVYLNNALIATQQKDDYSTQYATRIWWVNQSGIFKVRKLRIKKRG